MQDRNKLPLRPGLGRLVATSWNLALADGIALLSMAAFVVLLGRIEGTAALGKFSFAVALTSIAQTVIDAGFDITLPRSIRRNPALALRQTRSAIHMKLVVSVVILPLAVLLALAKDLPTQLTTLVLAIDVLPSTLSYALVASLRGLKKSSHAAVVNSVYNVVPVGLCAVLVFTHAPLYVYAVCILSGDVLKYFHLRSVFEGVVASRFRVLTQVLSGSSFFDRELLRTTWREQRGVTLTNLYSSLLVRLPSVMFGLLSTDAIHGVYAAASRFFSALRIVPGAVLNAILPEYSRRDETAPRIRVVVLLATLSAVALGSALYFGAPTLMSLTFGFQESVPVLRMLGVAFTALFIKTTLEAFLLAANRENIVNLALGLVTITAGAAYAFAATTSPLMMAVMVTAAECSLCFVFLLVFLRLHRRGTIPSMAEVDRV